MCTATAQESATVNNANAEREVYCATAGVTPKFLRASRSQNEECANTDWVESYFNLTL
jgi:hypothetical protein